MIASECDEQVITVPKVEGDEGKYRGGRRRGRGTHSDAFEAFSSLREPDPLNWLYASES